MARGGVAFVGEDPRNYALTAPGTPGQVLGVDADGDPVFQDASAGEFGSWIPLAVGTEPLAFVSDGNGNPILVFYTL